MHCVRKWTTFVPLYSFISCEITTQTDAYRISLSNKMLLNYCGFWLLFLFWTLWKSWSIFIKICYLLRFSLSSEFIYSNIKAFEKVESDIDNVPFYLYRVFFFYLWKSIIYRSRYDCTLFENYLICTSIILFKTRPVIHNSYCGRWFGESIFMILQYRNVAARN